MGDCFLVCLSLINTVRLKCLYGEFYKTSVKMLYSLLSKLYKTSGSGYFSVYLWNFIRLPLTAAFDLTQILGLIHLNLCEFSFWLKQI